MSDKIEAMWITHSSALFPQASADMVVGDMHAELGVQIGVRLVAEGTRNTTELAEAHVMCSDVQQASPG